MSPELRNGVIAESTLVAERRRPHAPVRARPADHAPARAFTDDGRHHPAVRVALERAAAAQAPRTVN